VEGSPTVRVDPGIRADPAAVRRVVVAGFDGVAAGDVEVRVERGLRRGDSFTGRAYPEPPRRGGAAAGIRYVVRLVLPGRLVDRGYPKSYRYVRRKTAPWITVASWRERLLALAAHEAWHVHQFRHGLRRSEVEAERWSERLLEGWRRRWEDPVRTHAGGPGPSPAQTGDTPRHGEPLQLALPV
jgi:hypothetical protein